MADYNQLKTAIAEVIRTNGNEEITGEVLQFILLEMVGTLGKDFQFAGVGTPSTEFAASDEKRAWILMAGTYENLGEPFVIAENQFAVLTYNGTFKVRPVTVGRLTDAELTEGSHNPVEGGAIYEEFGKVRAEFAEAMQTENRERIATDENLQQQINEIVSGDTGVALSASPVAVFADGADKTVEFTATSSPTAADITFKEKNAGGEGETVEGVNSHVFPVTVNSTSQETKTYQASFVVAGVSKGTKEASVKLVYPMFVGAGADYAGGLFEEQSARPTPAGTYNIETAQGDHLLFDVPEGMSISKVLLYDNPQFPTEVAVETVASSRTGLDGSAYTCFQSVSTFAAGTHAYKVS